MKGEILTGLLTEFWPKWWFMMKLITSLKKGFLSYFQIYSDFRYLQNVNTNLKCIEVLLLLKREQDIKKCFQFLLWRHLDNMVYSHLTLDKITKLFHENLSKLWYGVESISFHFLKTCLHHQKRCLSLLFLNQMFTSYIIYVKVGNFWKWYKGNKPVSLKY